MKDKDNDEKIPLELIQLVREELKRKGIASTAIMQMLDDPVLALCF